ncbi:hypothetical protein N0V88_006701 [Collariella sp. IMI 366227]|nr:hypothetical protein N0V88_006701 [Collariella sp. IMI 366227]
MTSTTNNNDVTDMEAFYRRAIAETNRVFDWLSPEDDEHLCRTKSNGKTRAELIAIAATNPEQLTKIESQLVMRNKAFLTDLRREAQNPNQPPPNPIELLDRVLNTVEAALGANKVRLQVNNRPLIQFPPVVGLYTPSSPPIMARLDEMGFDPSCLNKATAADYSSSESDAEEEDEYLMPSRNPHESEFTDYNPRKRRRTGRDAKESAALGIFGSESEDEGPGRKWKHKSLRNKGVSFVSSAKPKGGSDEEEEEGDEAFRQDLEGEYDDANPGAVPEEAEEDEDDDEEMAGVGLGFGGAAQGLGWTPPTQQAMPLKKKAPAPKSFVKSKFDSANPLGSGFTPLKKALTGGISSGPASGANTPRRAKPKYLTMDEIKKAAPGLSIPDAFTPILDMTGPGKKLLTTSSGLMTPTGGTVPAESVEAAENRKLVKRVQNDFMAILEEWQSLQERKAYLELQLKQEQQEMEELSASLQGNKSVTAACAAASQPTESGELDQKADLSYRLNRVITGLGEANSSLSDSMLPQIKDELACLAVAAIHPLFNQYRQLWEPLEEPKPTFVDGLNSIRALLGIDHHPTKKTFRKPTATPYETMMYELWLRTLITTIRDWNVRDPDPLIAVLDAWSPLLPPFVRTQLLQDIIRKLEEALQKWQPKKHTHNLPHRWIFPWLPYLPASHLDPKSSTGLVADVRRKFRQLIDAWDFRRGVIPGLRQWKDVLRPAHTSSSSKKDQWTPLVMNHLLPNMARYLRANFRVTPQDQAPYMGTLDKLFEWLDVIRPSMLGEVLVAELFPLWHDALYQWLLLEEANYEEIGAWFEWWQDEVLPEEVRGLPSVQAEFEKGSGLIERALDLGEGVREKLEAPEKGPALRMGSDRDRGRERRRREEVAAAAAAAAVAAARKPEEVVSFRQVMEEWCQDHDLQFMPERNKVHAEGPLYRISALEGKKGVLVYFKGDRLFVHVKDQPPLEIRRENEADWGMLLDLAS